MKLYIVKNGTKKFLGVTASTRRALANQLGSEWFRLDNEIYSVYDVFAQSDTGNTLAGATIGALVGLIGGPIGVIGGGVIGGLIGDDSDTNERIKVQTFNQS